MPDAGGMGGAGYGQIIGGISMTIGQILKANAQQMALKKLGVVANTPGLDLNQITQDALAREKKNLPEAQALASSEATGRQSLMDQLVEQSMPGFTAARDAGTAAAMSRISDPYDQQSMRNAQYQAAVKSMGLGVGGGSGQGLNTRGLYAYNTGQANINQGVQWLQALRGISPMATPNNALSMTGPDANSEAALRDKERTQRLQMLWSLAQAPGKTGSWGNAMWDAGAMLVGSGMGGGGMGGGGMSGGGSGGGGGGGQTGFSGGGGVSGNEVFVGNPTLSDYYGGWKS